MPDRRTTTDHDLLIELRVELQALRADVRDIKDNFRQSLDDHEKRIRLLETADNQSRGKERVINGLVATAAAIVIDYVRSRLFH